MTLGVSRFRFGTRFARLIFDFFGRILDNDESFPRTERVFRSRSARKNVFQTVSVFNRMYESIILFFDRRLLKKNKNYLRIFSDFNRIRTRKKKIKNQSGFISHTGIRTSEESRLRRKRRPPAHNFTIISANANENALRLLSREMKNRDSAISPDVKTCGSKGSINSFQ